MTVTLQLWPAARMSEQVLVCEKSEEPERERFWICATDAAVTVIVVLCVAPPQVTLYVVVVVGETEKEPATEPAVNPVPTQEVAFVLLHVREAVWPEVREEAEEERVAVGVSVPTGPTVIVRLLLALPAVPVQLMLYVVVVIGETETEPEVPVGVKLVAVQEVALVEPQVRVADWPAVMEEGAEREAVTRDDAEGSGSRRMFCDATPPGPVHVMVYEWPGTPLTVGVTETEPEVPVISAGKVGSVPEPAQDVVLVELQVKTMV